MIEESEVQEKHEYNEHDFANEEIEVDYYGHHVKDL